MAENVGTSNSESSIGVFLLLFKKFAAIFLSALFKRRFIDSVWPSNQPIAFIGHSRDPVQSPIDQGKHSSRPILKMSTTENVVDPATEHAYTLIDEALNESSSIVFIFTTNQAHVYKIGHAGSLPGLRSTFTTHKAGNGNAVIEAFLLVPTKLANKVKTAGKLGKVGHLIMLTWSELVEAKFRMSKAVSDTYVSLDQLNQQIKNLSQQGSELS